MQVRRASMEVTGVFLLSLLLVAVTAASAETGNKKRKTYNKLRKSFPPIFLLLLWDSASSNVPTAAMEKEASIFLGIRPRFIAPPQSKGNDAASVSLDLGKRQLSCEWGLLLFFHWVHV